MERVHPQAQGRIRARHEAVLNFLFFLERKESKRKSIVGKLSLAAFAAFVNVLHKTDGSHTNRPFLRSKQDERETVFSQKDILPRSVFCFFSSRKEIVPL
jgi:hypothetical protein